MNELSKKRRVRIEPNPFKRTTIKIKQSRAKVNSAGHALRDTNGNLRQEMIDPKDMIQVPGTTKVITPPPTASGLRTGLNVMIDNPYKDIDVYFPTWGEKILKGKDRALLQHVLEYKHGRELNHYTNNINYAIESSEKEAEMPFFKSRNGRFMLDGNVTFLNLDNPMHEVWYYVFRELPIVANSYKDLEEGKNQQAWYYMVDSQEVDSVKMDKIRKKTKAAAILEEINNEPNDIIVEFAKALENSEKNLTKQRAYTWLFNYYDESKTNYTKFMKYYELYKDAARREQFMGAALLQRMMDFNIIRERDNKYYWMMPETDNAPPRTFEWESKERFINDFLLAPEYQSEVKILNSIYEAKK